MKQVVLLVDVVSPYRIPVFCALNQLVDLHVLALADHDRLRSWPPYKPPAPFPLTILRALPGSQRFTFGRRPVHLNRAIRRQLRALNPEVVIVGGWNQPSFFGALAPPRRWKTVIWVESTSRDERSSAFLTRWLKRLALRCADAFVVPGKASAEHLAALGMSKPVHVAPNAVDIAYFAQRSEHAVQRPAGSPRLLAFVGRPEYAKGVDIAIEVVKRIGGTDLTILGDSDERAVWEKKAHLEGVGDRIRFEGHVPPDRVADVLGAADLMLFPSRSDPWGLVVNEAQAAGCPVVMSPVPGSAEDLAARGGALVVELDVDRWISEIRALLEDSDRLAKLAAAGRIASADFSPEACARGLAEVVQ